MPRREPRTTHSNLNRALDALFDGGGPTEWGYVHSKPAPDLRPMQVDLYPDEPSGVRALRRLVQPRRHPQLTGLACCLTSIALLALGIHLTGSVGVGLAAAAAPFVLISVVATSTRAYLAKFARPDHVIELISCRAGLESINADSLTQVLTALIDLDARSHGQQAAHEATCAWLAKRANTQHPRKLTRPDLVTAAQQCLNALQTAPAQLRSAA